MWSTIDFITEEGLNNSSSNICKRDNLILATRISPGKSIIARIDTAINQDLKIVDTNLDIEFLHNYFKSIQIVFLSKSSGSTVQGINLTNVKNTKIPVPTLEEQKKIVELIKVVIIKDTQVDDLCEEFLERIETIKKSVLAHAFRGEF